jgi:hypothetical protein
VTTEVSVRRFGVVPSVMAAFLGALGLALVAVWVALTALTGDLQVSRDGAAAAFAVLVGLLGMLVAWRQPRNPEGWLLLGLAVCALAVIDSGLYAVLDYRQRDGRLPLGEAAVFVRDTAGVPLIFLFAVVILLFPDGRLTRRWSWVLWSYVTVVAVAAVGFVGNEAGTIIGRHIQVDVNGAYSGPGSPAGFLGVLATIGGPVILVVPLFWLASVARQVLSWRQATGERRQQLKWLTAGAAIAVVGLALIVLDGSYVLDRPAEVTDADQRADVLAVVSGPDGTTVMRRANAGEEGWSALWNGGEAHDVQATGMLSAIVAPLAAAGVPVWVASSFDGDLVLVPADRLDEASGVLQAAGHQVRR